MTAIPSFSSFLTNESTIIAMAKLLDLPEATRLDQHRDRIFLYAANGIPAQTGMRFDRIAVQRANFKRAMDGRERIERGEMAE